MQININKQDVLINIPRRGRQVILALSILGFSGAAK
jgi:hypothetical protein